MEVIVQLAFVEELRMFGVGRLKFDGHFKIGLGIDALIYLAECPFSNFTDQLEIFTYLLRQMGHNKLSI